MKLKNLSILLVFQFLVNAISFQQFEITAGSYAEFQCCGMFIDSQSIFYLSDCHDNQIIKVDLTANETSVYVENSNNYWYLEGYGGESRNPRDYDALSHPSGLWGDSNGILYIADTNHHRIATVNSTGLTQNFVGNGTRGYRGENSQAISTLLNEPTAVTGDSSGNIYLSDTGNNLIRRVESGTQLVSTVAGNFLATAPNNDIAATSTALSLPTSLWMDSAQSLYFIDSGDSRIRRVNGDTRVVSLVAGTGVEGSCDYHSDNDNKQATAVKLSAPVGLWGDTLSRLYFGSVGDFTVQRIDLSTGVLSVVVGHSCNTVDTITFTPLQNAHNTSVLLGTLDAVVSTQDAIRNVYFIDTFTSPRTDDYFDDDIQAEYYSSASSTTRISVYNPSTGLVTTLFTLTNSELQSDDDYFASSVIDYVFWFYIVPWFVLCVCCCGICYCQRRGCYKYANKQIFPNGNHVVTDVVLLHDWSTDSLGRDNHSRIALVSKKLNTLNLTVAPLHDYSGALQENTLQQITAAIDNTKCVVVFVTEKYINTINNNSTNKTNESDGSYVEFEYAYRTLGPSRIVTVVMEESVNDVKKWSGVFGGAGGNHCIDMTSNETSEAFTTACITLNTNIRLAIHNAGLTTCSHDHDRHGKVTNTEPNSTHRSQVKVEDTNGSAYKVESGYGESDLECSTAVVEIRYVEQDVKKVQVSSDVVLIYDCGVDECGRLNEERVSQVNTELKKCGLVTWMDSEQLSGRVLHQLTSGVDGAKCAAVFVTESLMQKVNAEDGRENCPFAFNYALRVLGSQRVIAVVMEARMRDTKRWEGVFGGLMSGVTCVDLVQDPAEGATEATFRKKIEKELRGRIEEKMKLSDL